MKIVYSLAVVVALVISQAAFSEDSVVLDNNGQKLVINQGGVQGTETNSAPGIIKKNQDGSSVIQQGSETITTDANGNTVISDGKDSIVFEGSPTQNQNAPTGNIVINDPAQGKDITMGAEGIVIKKDGKTITLGK